jgi:hypothetical protein
MATQSLTFTISPGDTYTAYAKTSPRKYATYFMPSAPEFQLFRHHIPGVDGNIIVLGGRTGQQIVCGVRYHGADVASTVAAALTDFDSMVNVDVTITFGGRTWERCHLKSSSATKPARASGLGFATADYELVFDYDGATNGNSTP